MHLLRQVEPLTLRKQLVECFRVYSRRVPSTLEVVCSFCRRKVKKDQIARVEIPRRDPASAQLFFAQAAGGTSHQDPTHSQLAQSNTEPFLPTVGSQLPGMEASRSTVSGVAPQTRRPSTASGVVRRAKR